MKRLLARAPVWARPATAVVLVLGPLLACSASQGGGSAPTPEVRFDSARAWSDLEAIVGFGPRPPASAGMERQREFLVRELVQLGLDPVTEAFVDETPIGEIAFANVYADVGPADRDLVVLVSHMDTKLYDWEFVGANDGGSSTAVLLELARSLVAREAAGESRVSYRVLFVDGEESLREQWIDPDNRYGSRHHVRRLVDTGEVERVAACVVIDLVGDENLELVTDEFSDRRLLEFFFEAARSIGLGDHVDGPRNRIKDDHLSFMAANIPSVDLIDYEYGPNNAYWHTPNDVLENCSQASLEVIGRIVLAGLPALEAWVLR